MSKEKREREVLETQFPEFEPTEEGIRKLYSDMEEDSNVGPPAGYLYGKIEYLINDDYVMVFKEDYGGEGLGTECWFVMEFINIKTNESTFWFTPGWYQSHHGSEYEYENTYQAEQYEKTVTDWRPVDK